MSIESDIRALDDKVEKLMTRITKLEEWAHEPYDFTKMEERLQRLETPVVEMSPGNIIELPAPVEIKELDCDFYYFKPSGKWKYEGAGFYPTQEHLGLLNDQYYEVDHDAIRIANNGMPGITSDGKDYTVVVIPRAHCMAKYAYPRMIKAIGVE